MTKTIFRFAFILFTVLIAYRLSGGSSLSKEPELSEITEKAQIQQSKMVEEIEDVTFLAESVYRERKKDGQIKKEVIAERRVYVKGRNKRYEEYLSMSVNGRKLSKEEMEKKIKDQKKKSKDREEMKMPLTQKGKGAYDYYLIGSGTWNGLDVWIVGFKAKEKKDGYIDGKGYISKDSFDVIRAEFAPAKMPLMVKDIKIVLTYSEVQGYWMPAKFEMDTKVKISFLFYKHITVEDTYSEYKFNNQLEDSFFESE